MNKKEKRNAYQYLREDKREMNGRLVKRGSLSIERDPDKPFGKERAKEIRRIMLCL